VFRLPLLCLQMHETDTCSQSQFQNERFAKEFTRIMKTAVV